MNKTILNCKLLLYFITGTNGEGRDISKTNTFPNVHLDATKEKLANFSEKYVVLINHTHIKTSVADYVPITASELE